MATYYTYMIAWTSTKMKYYGCQYGKNANPNNILDWTYKTSSKYVREYVALHGKPDIIKIHKTFNSVSECRKYEHTMLSMLMVVEKADWLNRTNNKAICPSTYTSQSWKNSHKSRNERLKHDDEFKAYMKEKYVSNMHSEQASIKRKNTFKQTNHSQGKNNPRYGVIVSQSTKDKISAARKSQTALNKKLGANLNSKRLTCEYCGKDNLNTGNYKRWHGKRCKMFTP